MDYETIILQKKDNIATITLNRPEKLNAWSPRMHLELADVFTQFYFAFRVSSASSFPLY